MNIKSILKRAGVVVIACGMIASAWGCCGMCKEKGACAGAGGCGIKNSAEACAVKGDAGCCGGACATGAEKCACGKDKGAADCCTK